MKCIYSGMKIIYQTKQLSFYTFVSYVFITSLQTQKVS